jgi:hypothetical protein
MTISVGFPSLNQPPCKSITVPLAALPASSNFSTLGDLNTNFNSDEGAK